MKRAEIQIGIVIFAMTVVCHIRMVTGRVTNARMRFACENKTITLNCSFPYHVICLLQAVPEYRSKNICWSGRNIEKNTTCRQDDVLSFLDPKCHEKMFSCKVVVKSTAMGDHCKGTFKFISIKYRCVKPRGNSSRMACARSTATTSPSLFEEVKFTTKEKDSIIEDVVPSLSPSSATTPQLNSVKTCIRPVSPINPSKAKISETSPSLLMSLRPSTPQSETKNGSCELSIPCLVKVILSCICCMIVLS